jgi:hypothetical protein
LTMLVAIPLVVVSIALHGKPAPAPVNTQCPPSTAAPC